MTPEGWQRIEAIFQTAIDLSPEHRSAYLADECGADEELMREVLGLLRSSESADDFIESPIWTDSSFLNTSAKKEISNSLDNELPQSDRDNFLGRQIGVYRLTREIGRGGMGAVYLAERVDGEFFQKTAIKLIKRGMDSDFIVRRFRHERQILASFEHPFIARLLDGGTTDDNVPYFVMEYVEGETFYNFCDKNRMGVRDRLKLFQKVCAAIDYAHGRRIIHRDIKPSNILIDRSGSPKLLDFGIAKILDPDLIHESINPTASMLRMMTPDYASPEQVQGQEVTPSSDIYSLGVLLYEVLTGHRPYNFAGRGLNEVTHVICEVMPKPPSTIIADDENLLPQYSSAETRFLDVRSTNAAQLKMELAGSVDNVVMKALSKEPSSRYKSVGDFFRDISRLLSGAQVEAPRFSAKPRTTVDAAFKAPENSKALAVLPFKFLNLASDENTDDRFLGVGLADALITRLSKVRRFVVRPTSSILAFVDDRIDPIKAGSDLRVDYILDGSIKKANDRLRVTVQLLNVAENAAVWATSIDEVLSDVFTLEDTLANKVIEVLLPQFTGNELEEFTKRGTENAEAFEHYLRGRYHFNSFTEDGFAKAFVSFHRAIASDPNYAHAYTGIADYYNWLGIIGVLPPQDCFLPAIDAATKALELDEDLSEVHASLGFSLHAGKYEWSKAEYHLRRAIEMSPSNATAYVWFSIVLFTEGRFDEGLEFARRGAEIDPLAPFNHHNIGWGLYYARRYDEAVEQYRKVIADFPAYSFGYYGLSKIHRITGETKAAIIENDKARELMDNSIFSRLSEAECYAADGQEMVATSKLAALHTISAERYVSPYQLSLVYCYQKNKEKAIECLQDAKRTKEAWLNWMGVDPVLDLVRGDSRYEEILESIGYSSFFHEFPTAEGALDSARPNPPTLHNLTTLVIDSSDKTDDGFTKEHKREIKRKSLYEALAAAALFLVMGVGYLYLDRSGNITQPTARPALFQTPTIVVLPFKSEDIEDRSLGVGLADALTNKLGNIKNIQVISASTGRAVANLEPTEIEEELGVGFVLRGDLTRSEGVATLSAELISASANKAVWSEKFIAADGDLFGVQTKLAEKVWTSLGIEPLPLERRQVEKSYTENVAAYELYLIGRYQMTTRSADNLRKAVETFSISGAMDPNFALAYVGLADSYALLNLYDIEPPKDAYKKAKENAQRALQIDDTLAEAHASLAYVHFYDQRDRTAAELEFRRAIQVNPSYAQAHHWFAIVLAAMKDPIDATTEAQIAERLDPSSASVKSASGMTFAFNGQYAEAIAKCDDALAIDEGFIPALKVKRLTYVAMKDFAAAQTVFQKELVYSGGQTTDPGWRVIELQVAAPGENREANLALLEAAIASPIIKDNDRAFAFEVALAYNALEESEKALDWLERAEAARAHGFNYLEVDPRLINLREEPRFLRLVKKLAQP